MSVSPATIVTTLVLTALVVVGCDSSDPLLDGQRAKLVLPAEPESPLTPTDVKKTILEPTEFALAGRIDAGDVEPFVKGKATFVLSQLPDEAHTGGDPNHADNCPFCRRKLKNAPKATVQFLGSDGEILPYDARELFGVEKGSVVVVQGTGQYLEAVDTVQINADGIFVRR